MSVRSVNVKGNVATVALERTLSSGAAVTVSYTRGPVAIANSIDSSDFVPTRNAIQNAAGHAAGSLVNHAVSLEPPPPQRAYISRAGTIMTIRLDQAGLKGSFDRNTWSYAVDGRNRGRPTGGSLDADVGIVTLTFSPPVTGPGPSR